MEHEIPAKPFEADATDRPIVTAPLDVGSPLQRRLVALAELFLCSSLPTQLFIQALLILAGWHPTTPAGDFSLSFVVTMSLIDTAVVVGLMVLLTRAHGESVARLWIGGRPVLREVMVGISLVPLVFLVVVVLLNVLRLLTPSLHNVPTNPLEQMAKGGALNAAAFALVAIIAGGVREELQRAFLLRRFERHLGGIRVGVIVLSLAFGLAHAVQGWDAAITTGVLGAIWAVMYVRRRSSIAPLVSHAGFNSLEVLRVAMGGL